ncbi:MAG: AmmeMemoRadiSam system radical SAM enzyme, partial [Syntrophales bacterium]|nr:AmmeMemoRadiSam system radical SAM enzyme [Syntrophales bacterium]
YTYTEPTIFFEFARDVALQARSKGMLNLFVTNGYLSMEALELAAAFLDAANVDLKSFSDGFYRKYCGGRLEPVLDTLREMRRRNIWIEVTTLIIPTLNDSMEELRDMARFIRSLGPEVPWHISRYHPHYKMRDIGPTPAKTIQKVREAGMEEGLRYVYAGNLPGDEGEKTFCAECGKLLIDRFGFTITGIDLEGHGCPHCGTRLEGIFE